MAYRVIYPQGDYLVVDASIDYEIIDIFGNVIPCKKGLNTYRFDSDFLLITDSSFVKWYPSQLTVYSNIVYEKFVKYDSFDVMCDGSSMVCSIRGLLVNGDKYTFGDTVSVVSSADHSYNYLVLRQKSFLCTNTLNSNDFVLFFYIGSGINTCKPFHLVDDEAYFSESLADISGAWHVANVWEYNIYNQIVGVLADSPKYLPNSYIVSKIYAQYYTSQTNTVSLGHELSVGVYTRYTRMAATSLWARPTVWLPFHYFGYVGAGKWNEGAVLWSVMDTSHQLQFDVFGYKVRQFIYLP